MTEVRGFTIQYGYRFEIWTCIACGANGGSVAVKHTEECQWNAERLGLKYDRERAEKAVDRVFESSTD